MVPILDKSGKEKVENKKKLFKGTLADTMLPKYDNDLTFEVQFPNASGAKKMAVWRFIERYLRITNKDGQFVPLEMTKPQIELYIELCLQHREGRPMRLNILKARQLGFSTVIAAIIFTLTIFKPNQKACIVADKEENARNLFDKYITFYESLPEWFHSILPKVKNNARELRISYGSGQFSLIRILVQGEDSGRSYSFQYIHASECAAWKDLKKTLVSLLNTVSQTNVNSLIVLETTAKGFNEYKERWDLDVSGNTQYKALFFAWWKEKTYSLPYDGFALYDFEKELMEKYKLTLDQIAWYRMQYNDCGNDIAHLRQENPSNPTEAFITSGNAVFNAELLALRKEEIMLRDSKQEVKRGFFRYEKSVSSDGGTITLNNIEFVKSSKGPIAIYEEPDETHPYVINNDPAMGGEDYYATQVIDNCNAKQVAVYHENKVDADEVAFQMYCLGVYYCNALISGETNTTSYLLQTVHRCGYRNMYQDKDQEELGTRFYNKLGYKTKQTNRQMMIDMFVIAFRDNPKIINDYQTICEMESFQVVRSGEKEKAVATGGAHDDLVMAMCGAFYCRSAQRACPLEKKTYSSSYYFDPFKKDDEKIESEKVYQIWD